MRSESPEQRGRQKVAEPPSYRIENEYNPEAIPQYFQISVGVLEGRNFTWSNPRSPNSYVVVMLGKKKCRTNIKRNKKEPHYREYFAFGLYASLYDLQRSTLNLTVMEPRCCTPPHLLGEANIDLGTVWRQPYFQAFRKWTQLTLPRDPTAGSMGFLKVDITITCKSGVRMMQPLTRDNDVDVNYFLSSGLEQQQANFVITFHGAFGLPNTSRHQSEKHHGAKPPNTFVRVLFCGLQAKTAVQNGTNCPMYNEQVSMVEMFPSSNPIIRFEICSMDAYASRLLASKFLNLDHMSHDGENGFLPTFGPSLLPMYGTSSAGNYQTGDYPLYKGSLLISLNTIVPYYQQSLHSITVEPVVPIALVPSGVSREHRVPRGTIHTLHFRFFNIHYFFHTCTPDFTASDINLQQYAKCDMSMLDSRVVSDFCGVAITIGEIPNEYATDEGFKYMMDEVKTRKLHYTGPLDVLRTESEFQYLDFFNTYPILQATTQLPDYRFRMYRNNSIYRIVRTLMSALTEVERRLKNVDYTTPKDLLDEMNRVLDIVASKILLYLDNNSGDTFENVETNYKTELDKQQFNLQIEEMKKIHEKILQNTASNLTEIPSKSSLVTNKNEGAATRRTVKYLISVTHTLTRELKKLIFKATEGWPDVVIWLLNNGSRIGFCKIPIADVIYSNTPEECGILCGRIQSIYFKPLKCSRHVNSLSMGCFCVVGKVELLAWMGLHEQSSAFEPCLPNGYKLKIKDFDMCIKCNGIMVECRVFIYKARLLHNNIGDGFGHVYVRLNTLNTAQDSKAIEKSLTPVWNQLLRIQKKMYTSLDRLLKYPPVVLVEVNSTNLMGKTELIGSFQMDSVIDDTEVYIPTLQWYEMYKGMENTGKVLMSVQIFQVPEKILKSTLYTQFQECYIAPDMRECENILSDTELLPIDFIPKTTTYKLDIYWWGLRSVNITKKPYVVLETEDLTIKSEVINDKKSNCNFPNGRVSQLFEASFNELIRPSINLKLYDSCTFGRTLYIGTSVVKYPNRFFTFWYPKVEREAALKRASIMSSDFVRVSQTLCVKKKISILDEDDGYHNSTDTTSTNIRMKRSFWRRLFCRKEPDEEEYSLLPISPENCANKSVKKCQLKEAQDWWTRYLNSQKTCVEGENITGNQFIVYDSELERQPQFSKFKDWCATFKLYNGEYTGIPEKGEGLHCGFLKAGIAMYKWPPPENTVAVSTNGVDLNRGYFHLYPRNDAAKFLVRVYIIKGINLVTKKNSGKSHPYIIISCGSKQLGDRNSTIPNTYNPIFGTVYELRCTLPEEYQLTISLYNHDMIGHDELIGNTTIDLENRIYSKHRGRVGLASKYNLSEPGKWRDCIKPSTILEEMCSKNYLSQLSFPSSTSVMLNGVEYKDNEHSKGSALPLERRENICLSLLRNWDTLPVCGYPLVPEHVETRTLYNPDIPGIAQGKIHMWIDIFPIDTGVYIPPPVDITPRKTEEYELKLTIFKVRLFESNNKHELSKASNLYVRVWIGFADQMQNANCHLVSSEGYYIFNWCIIFSFKYDYAERKLVKKKINQFTDFEDIVSPEIKIQLMNSEPLSLDEPIGCLTLNLNEMSQGEAECPSDGHVKTKNINLFSVGSVRAWWLLDSNVNSDDKNNVGAIKMEVNLLPKQKTIVMPVGSERHPQVSSIPDRQSRYPRNSLHDDFNFNNYFYRHNALWGSLTGISIIILCIIIIIYFLLLAI